MAKIVRHASYRQLLHTIPKIRRCFNVTFLPVPDKTFELVRWTKTVSAHGPLLVLMAGCHGEEPAPSLTLFKNFKRISETAEKYGVNLVVYPLVNPWGFDRNKRSTHIGFNCNSNWIHKEDKRIANEVSVISKDIKKFKPFIFASIHEDDETKKEFYLFSFGDRTCEKPLLKVGGNYFPLLQNGTYGDMKVKNGVVYNQHDGSAEDFMFHRGCAFSCCTETPSAQALSKRMKCNLALMEKLIELASLSRS